MSTIDTYRTGIEKLKRARQDSLDGAEQARLTQSIITLADAMELEGFGEISARTAELQALVAELEFLLADLSQPTFTTVLPEITGFLGSVKQQVSQLTGN